MHLSIVLKIFFWVISTCFFFQIASAQNLTKIIPDEGGVLDFFGSSIAMSGDRLIVSAPFKDKSSAQKDAGAAFIFEREDSTWIQRQMLISNAGGNTRLGTSVDIFHEYAIVSSTAEQRAIIFKYNGNTWVEVTELKPFNGISASNFGTSVAITDEFAFVSSGEDLVTQNAGAVYVYQRQKDDTWTPFQKLFASNRIKFGLFGSSIDVHGDALAIGSPRTNGDVAALYVYRWTGREWVEKDILYTPTEFTVGNGPVDIHEDQLIIGVPRSIEIERYAGTAFMYRQLDGQWIEPEKKLLDDGRLMTYFGSSVAINEDYAVIGAPLYNSFAKDTGVAVVYNNQEGSLEEAYRIIPFDAEAGDRFGAPAIISGGFLAMSATYDDDLGGGSGSVYVHILTGAPTFYTPLDSTDLFARLEYPYEHRVHATGVPAPTYSLLEAPDNMAIDPATGLISWVPQSTGTFQVSALASNGVAPADTHAYAIEVLTPPSITSQPDTLVLLGDLYTYGIEATANPAAYYTLSSAPSGMKIDSVTGLIQWTPTETGIYEVVVNAKNYVNPSDSQRFEVLAGLPPKILSEPDTLTAVLNDYTYDVFTIGFPASRFSLALAPEGMEVDSVSGKIQWFPEQTGFYDVTLVADNSIAPADTQEYVIHVSTGVGNDEAPQPLQTTVFPAYPNPFSTNTSIPFQLNSATSVQLKVIDVTGKQIYIQDYPAQAPGSYELTWQGIDSSGTPAPAGLYFLVLYLSDTSTPLVTKVVKL